MPAGKDRIIVIGGGIQGCATAYFLAKRGQDVTLLEKDHIGRHASGVNAGGVRRLGRDPVEIPLSLASMDIWQSLQGHIGDHADAFHPCFYLKVALDEDGQALGVDRINALLKAGFKHEIWLEDWEVKRRLPHLSCPTYGGILVEGDGWALPWRIVQGFASAAVKHGSRLVEGCRVVGIERGRDGWQLHTTKGLLEAAQVVNCAGAWAAGLSALAGDAAFPLSPYAPMLAVTDSRPGILPAVIGVLGQTLSLKQLHSGQFVIGGGIRARANLETSRGEIDIPALAASMDLATTLFTAITSARIIRCWSGIEGYMPDGLPVIGRGSQPGLVHGFGFSAHGFQLGPAVGEALADLVMGQQPRISLAPFSPSRFETT
ncbi:MAG: FAD-dependent oxidoreductase [Rhodospirillaceae bacterium]|mgnify:CR=1 FL=1|nr:FAD-dependent oxidoreductase [Rhodospirillaceae bacterium]